MQLAQVTLRELGRDSSGLNCTETKNLDYYLLRPQISLKLPKTANTLSHLAG